MRMMTRSTPRAARPANSRLAYRKCGIPSRRSRLIAPWGPEKPEVPRCRRLRFIPFVYRVT